MAFIIFFLILKKLKRLELSPQNFLYDVLHLLYSGRSSFLTDCPTKQASKKFIEVYFLIKVVMIQNMILKYSWSVLFIIALKVVYKKILLKNVKGVFSKPSGNHIVGPIFCF